MWRRLYQQIEDQLPINAHSFEMGVTVRCPHTFRQVVDIHSTHAVQFTKPDRSFYNLIKPEILVLNFHQTKVYHSLGFKIVKRFLEMMI